MPARPLLAAAAIVLALSALVSCGDDDTASTQNPTTTVPDGAATAPPVTDTPTPPPTTPTDPPTTDPPATDPPATDPPGSSDGDGADVPAEELAVAEQVAVDFVDALGTGDIDSAMVLVGPVSEQNAGGPEGLRSLLTESTEGHGAWAYASDRTVTAIAMAPGLVAVEFEGTLQLEGTTEHRVEVFPVRKAESADAWFVEPWAHDLQVEPLRIVSPNVDDQEQVSIDGAGLIVEVEAADAGTVFVSFDGGVAFSANAESGERVRFMPPDGSVPSDVVVLLDAGPVLDTAGFVVT